MNQFLTDLGPPFSWIAAAGLGPLGTAFLLLAAAAVGVAGFAFMRRCPKCGAWMAGEITGRELLGSNEGWVSEKRKPTWNRPEVRKASLLDSGPYIYVVVHKIKRTFSCRKCPHQWNDEIFEIKEDWIKGRRKDFPV